MNKKILLLTFLTLFLMSMFATNVQAPDDPGLASQIGKFSSFIFVDMAKIPRKNQLAFGILLFILFQFGLSKVLEGKTPTILALVLAIASSWLIPDSTLSTIFKAYSNLFVVLLGLAGPMLGYYWAHSWFPGTDRKDYVGAGVFFLLSGWFLGTIMKTIGSTIQQSSTGGIGKQQRVGGVRINLDGFLVVLQPLFLILLLLLRKQKK